jgi:hypothetical protein
MIFFGNIRNVQKRVKIKNDPFGIFIDFQSFHSADKKSVYLATLTFGSRIRCTISIYATYLKNVLSFKDKIIY